MSEFTATLLAAGALALGATSAVAQSKAGAPVPEQTGAQYCEFSKGNVETLKNMLKTNSGSWSAAMRASTERDIAATEKEAATCCSDLAQCKRDFEAPPVKPGAKPAAQSGQKN